MQSDIQNVLVIGDQAPSATSSMAKLILDKALAFLSLAAFLPLMIVVAVCIKSTSRGPLFFSQCRIGLNGRGFRMYKFRTMVEDAELKMDDLADNNQMSPPAFKMHNDPRITMIGRYLRMMSIDELPQLWNVLRGDMSMVGPRPLPCKEARELISSAHRRHSVRPGITGIWQVSGRNMIDFESWMKMDLHYIDNWSLWMDAKILAQTIPAVLSARGAS